MRFVICGPCSLKYFSNEVSKDKFQHGGNFAPSLEEQVRFFSKQKGMEIHVIIQNENYKTDVVQLNNIYFHLLRCTKHFKLPTLYFFDSKRIISCIREIKPDIVEAHWTYEYAIGALRSGYPCVIRPHDWMPHEYRISKEIEFYLKCVIQKYVLRKSRFIIGDTPYISNLVRPCTSAEIYTIPNMVFPYYYTLKNRETSNIIFSPSGILKRKNTLTLLELIKKLITKVPNVYLILAGPQRNSTNKYYIRCRDTIRQLEAQRVMKNVGLLDYKTLAYYYSLSSVVIHTSVDEAFGMVVAEAQAAGKPVIAAKSGGVEFIIQDGETGFIVEPYNIDAYVEKLEILMNDSRLRREMGLKGRERMKKILNPEMLFKENLRVYKHIISNW